MRSRSRQPVILIGMHRSGTTLLSRILDRHGLFVGWRLAAHHESSFFNRQNSWLFSSAGARWDTPNAVQHLLDDAAGRKLALAYLGQRMSSPAAIEFLGPSRYLRLRRLPPLREPWGWKDPRTTITLPLWLDLFPQARVIHLVRHGVDVAESLFRRQRSGQSLAAQRWKRYRLLFWLLGRRGWFGTSPRLAQREEGVRLWEEYLTFAERNTRDLGDRLLVVRFEDLLAQPRNLLQEILRFCDLPIDDRHLDGTIESIRPQRAEAFRRHAELVELWERVRERRWMRAFGYGSDLP